MYPTFLAHIQSLSTCPHHTLALCHPIPPPLPTPEDLSSLGLSVRQVQEDLYDILDLEKKRDALTRLFGEALSYSKLDLENGPGVVGKSTDPRNRLAKAENTEYGKKASSSNGHSNTSW